VVSVSRNETLVRTRLILPTRGNAPFRYRSRPLAEHTAARGMVWRSVNRTTIPLYWARPKLFKMSDVQQCITLRCEMHSLCKAIVPGSTVAGLRSCGKIGMRTGLADGSGSVCPTLTHKNLRPSGAGAFACELIFSSLWRRGGLARNGSTGRAARDALESRDMVSKAYLEDGQDGFE
jgi:hypothetical protein